MGFADSMGLYMAFGNYPATNLDPTGRFIIADNVGELVNAGWSGLRGDRDSAIASMEAGAIKKQVSADWIARPRFFE